MGFRQASLQGFDGWAVAAGRAFGAFGGWGGGFLDYFGGGFVFAEAEEGGLAELVVGGPGGEADLGDEGSG